jgi:hypothetical protein
LSRPHFPSIGHLCFSRASSHRRHLISSPSARREHRYSAVLPGLPVSARVLSTRLSRRR